MNVGSLFSGIGGFDLGLERAGMRIAWQSEIDPYACAVLRKRWPDVPNLGDVTAIRNPPAVDLICGGFPCQDISVAGAGAGIDGARSGLWREYARIVGEVRPRYVLVENVAALLGRGLGRVLGDLAALGYDAEWHCIPASAVGAPHRRDRIWIIAYPNDPAGRRRALGEQGGNEDVANAQRERQPRSRESVLSGNTAPIIQREAIDALDGGFAEQWGIEPDVGRVANGIPARMDRLRTLGNAIVPQIAEILGRAILSSA